MLRSRVACLYNSDYTAQILAAGKPAARPWVCGLWREPVPIDQRHAHSQSRGNYGPLGKELAVGLPVPGKGHKQQLWVPPGFAHGFLTLSESAEFLYKTTDYYAPAHERCIAWNDPEIAVDWPLEGNTPQVSAKDAQGLSLASAELFP